MRLRRLFVAATLCCGMAAAYVASPFVSAWNLREAIKRGDTSSIETRVAWPTVRQSLKSSLAKEANLLPMANEAGAAVRPTLWQRLKGAFGATMLDRFIETYVTPEGLPKLFEYRQTWRDASMSATPVEPEPQSKVERFQQFWSRIKRAEFRSLGRVEIEIADRSVADRRYVSVMELDGLGWKLTELSVVSRDATGRLADLENPGQVSR